MLATQVMSFLEQVDYDGVEDAASTPSTLPAGKDKRRDGEGDNPEAPFSGSLL